MKPFHPANSSRRGIALLLVLAFLALLSGLIVAFFATTSNTRREAVQFEAGVTVNQLADMTTNIVVGQLTDGMRSWETPPANAAVPNTPGTNRLTYITQPGMVRTYDDKGNPNRFFKLYSSNIMVTPVPANAAAEWNVNGQRTIEVPDVWPTQPAKWADINAPVLTPSPNGTITVANSSQKYVANYPILDPAGLAPAGTPLEGIQGFNILNPPGVSTNILQSGRPVVTPTYNPQVTQAGKTGNPAPMPVMWLYVLQNGTVTSPANVSANGLVLDWSNLPDNSPNKPSKTNPIVGRIAFWTDDDTCKLNPNVHSEGVMWDKPVIGLTGDSPYSEHRLTDYVPVAGEVQRFPGHPATVCLSPLFGLIPYYRNPDTDYPDVATLNKYYDLVPRVSAGGSQGGTVLTVGGGNTAVPNPIVPDQDRLYATPDELIYKPDRTPNPNITRADLEKMKFFLTTNAKAPETTLFNQPRISMWTLQQRNDPNQGVLKTPTMRNVKDKLLAFCGTIGTNASANTDTSSYFFQKNTIYVRDLNRRDTRQNASSVDYSWMRQIRPQYTEPSALLPQLDWTNVTRNQQLFKYLQNMTDQAVPGFGVKITDRYIARQRDQLLTEMVDLLRLTNGYSRSGVGYGDSAGGNQRQTDFDKNNPMYDYAPSRENPDGNIGESSVVPLTPQPTATVSTLAANTHKGFGRFPTITEAVVLFYNTSDKADDENQKVRMVIFFECYMPTSGSWKMSPLVRYVGKGLDSLKATGSEGQKALFPASTFTNWVTARNGYGAGSEHNKSQCSGIQTFYYYNAAYSDKRKTMRPSGATTSDEETMYPFISDEFTVKKASSGKAQFDFSGGQVQFEIHAGYATSARPDTLVQTVNLNFPPMKLYLPNFTGQKDFATRLNSPIKDGDTVRSLEVDPNGPTKGDFRIVAAQKDVPANFYAMLGASSGSPEPQISHSYRNGDQAAMTGGDSKSALFQGQQPDDFIAARGMVAALTPPPGGTAATIPGDWDNGGIQQYDNFRHGAYVNKPDDYPGEGNGVDENNMSKAIMTPNRQIYSPVVFGSLPPLALVPAGGGINNYLAPWRSLLFCRNPNAGDNHPAFTKITSSVSGAGTKRVPDHLLLDYFTMPVVEPYAVSEPLATTGRVNLNYQIAPFSYITRNTALRGVLKSTRVIAIPTAGANTAGATVRKQIDADETLKGFDNRFALPISATNDQGTPGGLFRSASEICDMWLVPKGASLAQMPSFWSNYLLTGDAAREQPYGEIHSRVTVRSNTFTVHMRVQTLRKRPSGDPTDWAKWREDVDGVTGEYRGATTIERYVDLGDTTIPDFATNPNATLDKYYKFRVLQTKRFNP